MLKKFILSSAFFVENRRKLRKSDGKRLWQVCINFSFEILLS